MQTVREKLYTQKELTIGYQLLMLKQPNERRTVLISEARPSVLLAAEDSRNGKRSDLEFSFDKEFGLQLKRGRHSAIPALLNGKRLGNQEFHTLENGSVLQIGEETIKVKSLQIKLGRQGPATRTVYTSERRLRRRQRGENTWTFLQGGIAVAIAISLLLLKLFS
jgi:hypothetical protein